MQGRCDASRVKQLSKGYDSVNSYCLLTSGVASHCPSVVIITVAMPMVCANLTVFRHEILTVAMPMASANLTVKGKLDA
ncbi:hypothetical protein EMCRGX_G001462 [Ephydatia muelleri]